MFIAVLVVIGAFVVVMTGIIWKASQFSLFTKAIALKCSTKKLFWEILHNSQENVSQLSQKVCQMSRKVLMIWIKVLHQSCFSWIILSQNLDLQDILWNKSELLLLTIERMKMKLKTNGMKSSSYHFRFANGCLPQILLSSFLNTLIHMLMANIVS